MACASGGGQGERLLAQDVLAGPSRGDRPFGVQVVGQRDVDRVDVRVGEERLVGAVGPRDPELGRRPPPRARLARGDREDLAARRTAHPRDDLAKGDVGRREDAPARRSAVGSIASPCVGVPGHPARSPPPPRRRGTRRLDTIRPVHESGTSLQERITNRASRHRRHRPAQRDDPSSEPQRHPPGPARARPAVPLGARRRHRTDPQRDPRPGPRAGRRGVRPEEDPVRLGTPGRPSPLVRPQPTGAVVLAFEVLVDSIAAAIVGLGGGRSTASGSNDPSATSRSMTSSPSSSGSPASCGPRAMARWSASASRSPVWSAARDGLVFMAPNLGWVDVPFGARLARALELDAADHGPQRRRCRDARGASPRRGGRRGRRALHLG